MLTPASSTTAAAAAQALSASFEEGDLDLLSLAEPLPLPWATAAVFGAAVKSSGILQ